MVTTHGVRHDTAHLFTKSSVLTGKDAAHYPYLMVRDVPNVGTAVVVERNIADVLAYPDDTLVLWQWAGRTRSDFFSFTVGEFRAAREAKAVVPEPGGLPFETTGPDRAWD